MTINNTIYKSEVETLRTKTEVEIVSPERVICSRIINSRLFNFEMNKSEPITISQIANISRVDNELFMTICENI